MTEEDQPEQDVPPSYTAPIDPEDDTGFVEFRPQEEEGIDLHREGQENNEG